jgi:hypothetical protein
MVWACLGVPGIAAAHATEPDPVSCLTAVGAPVLEYGARTVDCALDAPAEVDAFTFDAVAGDHYRLVVASGEAELDPEVSITAPSAAPVIGNSCAGDGVSGCSFEIDMPSLPETGIYTVRVSDFGNNETGAYELRGELIPFEVDPVDHIAVDVDFAQDFSWLESPTDTDQWIFEVAEGDRIDMTIAARDDQLDLRVEVFGMDGALVAGDSCGVGGLPPEPAPPLLAAASLLIVVGLRRHARRAASAAHAKHATRAGPGSGTSCT